jgi:hypothetical protein
MGDNESRVKRTRGESWPHRHCKDNRQRQLVGERHIVGLISLGAPLPGILNKLCTAVDLQIGNVVSLIWLPDEQECHICSITQSAAKFGLNPFSSTDILSRQRRLLGTLQIYCCDRRRPTRPELQLIERVVELAAIALHRRRDAEYLERPRLHLGAEIGGSSPGRLPFVN